ncbi:hypothetical protein [Actinomycetospora sp. NBC_00405]
MQVWGPRGAVWVVPAADVARPDAGFPLDLARPIEVGWTGP